MATKKILRFKFLRKGFKSENGDQKWKRGVWVKVDGELDICNWGLHACKEPYDAFSYVQGEILAQVECRGEHITEGNKECWREQRVVKAWRWTKKDSVALAIYSAELCLPNYEKRYKDKAPRLAIEAAKRWLKTGSCKGLKAARSAAWSAAESARSAAESARSAAWSAAESAWSAWSAARSAAESVESAESAAIKKIQKFFTQRLKKLKQI